MYEDSDGRVRVDDKLITVFADGSATSNDFINEMVRTSAGWRIKYRKASGRDKKSQSFTVTKTDDLTRPA